MPPKCPHCGTIILIPEICFREPFKCRACSEELFVPQTYFWAQACAALAASSLGSFLLGLRGPALLGLAVLLWVPATIPVVLISQIFFPPRLRIWTEDGSQITLKLR